MKKKGYGLAQKKFPKIFALKKEPLLVDVGQVDTDVSK